MLSAPQLFHKTLKGQEVTINFGSKVLILNISNVFKHAGEKLKWNPKFGNEAFGINKDIVNFILGARLRLLIRHDDSEYWINYDRLRDFKKSVFCISFVSKNLQIYNIPLSLFMPKPNFSKNRVFPSPEPKYV